MITIDKTSYGYLLGYYSDGRKQFEPCTDLLDVEIAAHRLGLTLQDNAKIWHNVHNGDVHGQSSV